MRLHLVILTLIIASVPCVSPAVAAPARPTPPPRPAVAPLISAPVHLDKNASRVDDRIEEALRKADPNSTAPDELVEIEALFSDQVTQAQIDAYLKSGGTINHVFTHVSYGWTGRITRRAATVLPARLGKNFVAVLEKMPAILHMDEAARCARVRPVVWGAGVTGQGTGVNSITIAILDTGLDGSHADLAGRQEYWKDWTSDNHASPQDKGHHGSHVAGIATGTGAASGVSPATLSFVDMGTMPSTSGSFYPSPFHIPPSISSFNWSSSMTWQSGMGRNARVGQVYTATSGSYGLINSLTGATSPLTTSTTVANPYPGGTSRFTPFASKASGGGTPEYVMQNTVTYAGAGDGYNTLSGVAPESKWAGFKVFSDDGGGSSTDIDEALDDLVAQRVTHNIKVANMSLGYDGAYTPTRDKTNTAAANGIVVCVSAGNSGDVSAGVGGEIGDPGRAHYCITVASSSDVNQLTDYSSHGFAAPGDASAGDEDMKPDIMAPGGSTGYQSNIFSVDSNSGDSWDTTGQNYGDGVADNYLNIQGTSMASPFQAGCAALVIDALQQTGDTWEFTGAGALADVLKVKMLLLMTATETNIVREAGPSGNPVLNRGGKDINEGFGITNADAAVETALNPVLTGPVITGSAHFGPGRFDKRCWARRVLLTAGQPVNLTLTVPPVGDYDIYLYSGSPDLYGNPVIKASSTNSVAGVAEIISVTPSITEVGYLVVKRVTGGSLAPGDAWTVNGLVPVSMSEFIVE